MANLTSFQAGDIVNSTVLIGDNNVSLTNVAAGARIRITKKITQNVVQPDTRPNYWPRTGRVSKLPKPLVKLYGRQQELAQLRAAIQAAVPVSMWSPNGLGKTAIARQLTHALNDEDAARNVVYLDAEKKWGIEDLQQMLFELFIETKTGYVPSAATRPAALSQVKALVVVDNVSMSAADSESLVNAASGCAFILISNERLLAADDEAIVLTGLSGDDARELFEKRYGATLGPADQEAFGKLLDRLHGSPDELLRAAERGQAQHRTITQLLEELGDAPDERALAEAAVAPLDETARRLLAFLAATGGNTVPLEALQLAFPGVDAAQKMEEVKQYLLAQSHSPRYSLCGALPSGLAQIWDLTAWQATLYETSVAWLAKQTDADSVVEAYGMLMQALTNAAEQQKWADVLRLGRMLEPWLMAARRWQAWFDVLNLILRAAQGLGDRLTEGWALHQLGSRALFQGVLEPARSYMTRALEIRRAIGDRAGMEVTRNNLDALNTLAAPPRGNGSGRGSTGGGHTLTYSFFGFTGLIVLAAAAYMLTHRTPPVTPEPSPLPAVTTAAPVSPSWTASSTPKASMTPSRTPTLTPTPTETPTPTIPAARVPFAAYVTSGRLNCHYGPGRAYITEWVLSPNDEVLVLGRAETTAGPYVYVKYSPKFGTGPALPCWVDASLLDLQGGDITALPEPYPDKAPLIQFTDPKYVPYVFPPPTDVQADRYGNVVSISWTGKNLADGDRWTPGGPIFLSELWTCIDGRFLLTATGFSVPYDPNREFVQGFAKVQDDAGCPEQSHGWIWLAHVDGYVGPAYVKWP